MTSPTAAYRRVASLAKRCLLPDDSEIPRPCRQSQWHRPRAPALQAPYTERAPCAGYRYSGCRTVLYRLSPELDPRVLHPDAKRAGLILVTTDKGLCGSLNTHILRMALAQFKALEAQARAVDATAIGGKGAGFLNRLGANIVSQVTQLGDTPQLERFIGAIKVQLDAYAQGELSAVMLAYTRFVNTMKQAPVIEQLLPLTDAHLDAREAASGSGKAGEPHYQWDYLYEPDPKTVL